MPAVGLAELRQECDELIAIFVTILKRFEKAGEQMPREVKLPTPAELNMMAQKQFERHGSGNKSDWDLAFEHGYEDGFNKTHPAK